MNTKERSKRNAFFGGWPGGFRDFIGRVQKGVPPFPATSPSGFQPLEDRALGGGQRIWLPGLCEVGQGVVLPLHERHSIEKLLELFGRQGRANARESARNLTARGSKGFALSGIIRQEKLSSIRKRADPMQDSSPIGQSSRNGDNSRYI